MRDNETMIVKINFFIINTLCSVVMAKTRRLTLQALFGATLRSLRTVDEVHTDEEGAVLLRLTSKALLLAIRPRHRLRETNNVVHCAC